MEWMIEGEGFMVGLVLPEDPGVLSLVIEQHDTVAAVALTFEQALALQAHLLEAVEALMQVQP